ncbi:DNA helicase [Bacillus sp. AK031]
MTGWIKFQRSNIESVLWNDPFTLRLFLLLSCRVLQKDCVYVKEVKVEKGQYLRSFSLLAEDLMYVQDGNMKIPAKTTVKRSVDRLVKFGYITTETTLYGTLFTLVESEADCQDFFCDKNGTTGSLPGVNLVDMPGLQQEECKKEKKDKHDLKDQVKETKEKSPEKPKEKSGSEKTAAVTDKFLSLRNSGLYISPRELCAIEKVCELEVEARQLVTWMEEVHAHYKKRNKTGNIKSFLYYEKALMQKLNKADKSVEKPGSSSVLVSETNDLLAKMKAWRREGEKRLANESDRTPLSFQTV